MVFRKRVIAILAAICLVAGALIGVSTSAFAGGTSGVDYDVEWASDSALTLTVSANKSGTAHYVVLEEGSTAPTEAQVEAGTALTVTAGTAATATVAADSTVDQVVYVAYTDEDNESYGVAQLDLPARSSSSSTERVGTVLGNAAWNGSTSVTLELLTEKSGTAYYLMQDADEDAPTADEVMDASHVSTTAGETTSVSLDASSTDSKSIYVVFDTGSATSDVLSLTLPQYIELGAVNYSATWSDLHTVKIGAVPPVNGTVHYIVREATADAPTAAEVLASGSTFDATTSGASVLQSVSTTSAKKIYLVFTDGSNVYQMSTMDLPAYGSNASSADSTATGSVQYSAERTDGSTMNLSATSTAAGTVHYVVVSHGATAPTEDAVKASTNTISCTTANTAATATVSDLGSGAYDVYFAFQGSDGTWYEGVSKIEVPAYQETTTEDGPSFEVLSYNPDFGTRTLYYGANRPAAQTITIKNTGSKNLTFSLDSDPCHSSATSDNGTNYTFQWYELSSLSDSTLGPGETATFTIQPKVGATGAASVLSHDANIDYYFHHRSDGSALTASVTVSATTDDYETVTAEPLQFTFKLIDIGGSTGSSYTGWRYLSSYATTLELKYYENGVVTDTVTPVYCINLTQPLNRENDTFTPFIEHDNADSATFGEIAGAADSNGTRTFYKPDENDDGNPEVRSAEDAYKHVKLVLANGYNGSDEVPSELSGITNITPKEAYYAATQSAIWYFTNYQNADSSDPLSTFLSNIYSGNQQLSEKLTDAEKSSIRTVYNRLISDNPGTYTDTNYVIADIYENILGQTSTEDVANYQNLIHGTVSTSSVYTGEVTVSKEWSNVSDSQKGSVTFNLYRTTSDGTKVFVNSLTLDGTTDTASSAYEDSAWHGVFKNLPTEDSDGNGYTYTVEESTISTSWSSAGTHSSNSWTFTNSGESSTDTGLTLNFTKTWAANDSTVPTTDQFADWLTLLGNGEALTATYKPAITTNGNTWTVTYKNLPATDSDGNSITYTVVEDADAAAAAGFTRSISSPVADDGSLTNTGEEHGTTSVSVTKTWADVPEAERGSVTFKLYRTTPGGVKEYTGLMLTLDGTADTDTASSAYEDSAWHGVFKDLPTVNSNGVDYTYTVEESTTSDNWELTGSKKGSSNDWTFTNSGTDTNKKNEKGTTEKKSNHLMPKTGDSTSAGILAVVAAAGLGLAGYGLHRRRNDA